MTVSQSFLVVMTDSFEEYWSGILHNVPLGVCLAFLMARLVLEMKMEWGVAAYFLEGGVST